MKLLYDDEENREEKLRENELQCTRDYEFLSELHNHTINMWKMILYWKKRREMCFTTPFLQLDIEKVIRSINKTSIYFEEKINKHAFLREKSKNIGKTILFQVKDTAGIIEFLKDLKKESLRNRHWIQIFNIMKAPHLKNSKTFTIVNLKEVYIQNFQAEI